MSKRKIGIMVAVLVLLMVGVVWALRRRDDPEVERLKHMLGDGPPQPGQFEQFRKEMEKLTPDQRRQVGEEMRQRRERQMDKQLAEYFKLPPDKRREELAKRIDEMEKRRKEREQRRAQSPQGDQGQNPGGQGPGGTGQGQGPPGQGQGQGGSAGGGQGGGRNNNPTAQSTRNNQRLDNTSPVQRAQRLSYFAAMQQQRIQAGLPANPFGGRGFGGR